MVPPLEVRGDGWSFMAGSEHELLNREDPGVAAGTRPLRQRRRVTCRVSAPFHLVLRPDFLDAGGTNVIGFFLQPETADHCRIQCTLWRDDLDGDPARTAVAVAFEEAVLAEDLAVQEAYDERSLPLEPTAEVHTRADGRRSSRVACSPTSSPPPARSHPARAAPGEGPVCEGEGRGDRQEARADGGRRGTTTRNGADRGGRGGLAGEPPGRRRGARASRATGGARRPAGGRRRGGPARVGRRPAGGRAHRWPPAGRLRGGRPRAASAAHRGRVRLGRRARRRRAVAPRRRGALGRAQTADRPTLPSAERPGQPCAEGPAGRSSWPPKPLRMADSTWLANRSRSREEKRE